MDHNISTRVRRVLDACRDDPALFQAAILGRDLWARQLEVCQAVAANHTTLVPAGRAVGKSFLLAGLVLWWLYTRPHSLVITTGPDHRQVVTVLWKEIRRALRPRRVAGTRVPRVALGHTHISQGNSSPQSLALQGDEWRALGFAAATEEGFSGQHAGELLVIVDEASGIHPPIWSAIHGLAACKVVAAGNPIRYDCHFRELHDLAQGGDGLQSVPISSLESPDAGNAHSPHGMASKTFLNQMRRIHGEDSPWWRSNILGLFPSQHAEQFLPAAWLDACTRQDGAAGDEWRDLPPGPATLGVDVAGGVGADRSAIVVRNNKQLLEVFASEWHGVFDDARERLEPVVVRLARKWKVAAGNVVYDKGGPGRSFGSYLANHGLDGTIGHFGAGKGGKHYVNRRTANAFAIKRRLDPHRDGYVPFHCHGIPQWGQLRTELAALRQPGMEIEDGKVKQALEGKDALAARLGHSPDLLDAFLMTFSLTEL